MVIHTLSMSDKSRIRIRVSPLTTRGRKVREMPREDTSPEDLTQLLTSRDLRNESEE